MPLQQMVLSSGGGGGVTEYASYAALVADSPAPADGAQAIVTGQGLFTALSGVWLPYYFPRATLLTAYSWDLDDSLADITGRGALSASAAATKAAGNPLNITGSGSTPALSGALAAEKGTLLMRGVSSSVGTGATFTERLWIYLMSAANNCNVSWLGPKASSIMTQRISGGGSYVGRQCAMVDGGAFAVGWDFSGASAGVWLWSPDDAGAQGGAGLTAIRSELAAGGASRWWWLPSLSGTSNTDIDDCKVWSAT
jgi:hypothetical protein